MLLALTLVLGCDSQSPEQRVRPDRGPRPLVLGRRRLAVAIGPSRQDYHEAMLDAIDAGSEVYELPQQWKSAASLTNRIIRSQLHKTIVSEGLEVVLTLNPLDTMENQIPEDLRGRPYDAPEFLQRYAMFADTTLGALPGVRFASIAIGNEVDVLLGDDEERWSQYGRFFRAAKTHLSLAMPGVPVGVKVTYDAFRQHRSRVDALVADSDVVMVNYYPIDGARVRPVAAVHEEIEKLVAAYPGKPIQLTEVGYPTSEKLGSSPDRQAEFVAAVFDVWDRFPAIELVNFVWINEMKPEDVDGLVQSFGADAPLANFLGSLGLRSSTGDPKPGFLRLVSEAQARGFGLRRGGGAKQVEGH